MPKMKTHSGASKRFRVTGGGRIKFKRAGMRHNLGRKPKATKKKLIKPGFVHRSQVRRLKRLMRGG